jgi:sugar O-acyltransferase (sialic acid O-acetyltransferase NeuD family)
LVGAGGHARSCIDVIEQDSRFSVAGLVGLPHEVGMHMYGHPVLGSDTDLPSLVRDFSCALVALGQIKTPDLRIRLFEMLKGYGCDLPTIMSPHAYVSQHASVGEGTIVMHGAIINAGARIGRNCIINSRTLIEHDAVIDDHCHIATAAVINGNVSVGEGSFIGSNVCIRQGVSIGARGFINMGEKVFSDWSGSFTTSGGNPQ